MVKVKQVLKSVFFDALSGYIYPNCGIISDQYRFIYFPVEKVANSSWKTWLAEVLDLPAFSDVPDEAEFHRRLRSMKNFPTVSAVGKYDYPDYFKFGFVRDPWDRLVSLYKDKVGTIDERFDNGPYRKNGVGLALAQYGVFYAGMSFDEFVSEICKIPDVRSDVHFRSQHLFFKDIRARNVCDWIGKFEDLGNGVAFVSEKLQLPDRPFPHLIKTKKTNDRDFYTKASKELVGKRYRKDIRQFGYSFD